MTEQQERQRRRLEEVNATLDELSHQFAANRTRADDDDDNDTLLEKQSARRPFMTLNLFGHTWAAMSRPFYERLPRLLRALADRLLVVHKQD